MLSLVFRGPSVTGVPVRLEPNVAMGCIWRPSREGFLKINTNASFILPSSRVFGGIAIRYYRGKLVAGDTFNGVASDALFVEAIVLRSAMLFAHDLGVDHIIVESDNLNLIKACRGRWSRRVLPVCYMISDL